VNAQINTLNKKPQSKLVNHVTIDVKSVKMQQTCCVQNVPKIITYMEQNVFHVPYVQQLKLTIVTQQQTNVYLVTHNVKLAKQLPTIVLPVLNQELTHQFVIAQLDNSMMA
jgi:hypothetical protein